MDTIDDKIDLIDKSEMLVFRNVDDRLLLDITTINSK